MKEPLEERFVVVEEKFVTLVRKMRKAQLCYFKTKNANFLIEAKRLEKEVDAFLLELEEREQGEKLFPEELK